MAEPLHTKSKKRSKRARTRQCKIVLAQLARELERAQKLSPQSLLKSSEAKPRLLTTEQTSKLVGLSEKTLANLRSNGMADLPYQ